MRAMSASPAAVLRATLHELHGAAAELERWTATPLTKRGRRRVARYELCVRRADQPRVERHEWVGKTYARPEDGQRVAALVRQLAASGCGERGGFVTARVLGYHASCGLLLLSYEPGESVTKAIVRDTGVVLGAIGRALAVLHTVSVASNRTTDAHTVLLDLTPRIAELAGQFAGAAALLHAQLGRLAGAAPRRSAPPALLHGDLGLAQLLWRSGTLVILDFDEWTRGDPALDLGTFLTQLRRLTVRKPGKLPSFDGMRSAVLEAYQRWSSDADVVQRVAWYERATLLRKIHSLVFDVTRHPEPDALRQRQIEAQRLLELCERDAG
jgi:Phosphotransferase enzyme family